VFSQQHEEGAVPRLVFLEENMDPWFLLEASVIRGLWGDCLK
jgi:hypothetical protein